MIKCRGMNNVLSELRKELKKEGRLKGVKSTQRFFKNEVKCYGISSETLKSLSKKYFDQVKGLDKKSIFNLCENLFSSLFLEEALIASDWTFRIKHLYVKSDINVFQKWVDRYINDWAKCDSFCNHSVGFLIEKYPEMINKLKSWAKSKNVWLRRASAVSLIVPVRKGLFLEKTFEISDILLLDKEDMVQKGYGWLLKVASHKHQEDVFDYVMSKKNVMPRTSLRYAIEKMPRDLKKRAMEK